MFFIWQQKPEDAPIEMYIFTNNNIYYNISLLYTFDIISLNLKNTKNIQKILLPVVVYIKDTTVTQNDFSRQISILVNCENFKKNTLKIL